MKDNGIYYVEQGRGRPVILLHGAAASLHDWNRLVPDLASKGYHALAPDLPGHGDSIKPEEPSQYSIENFYRYLQGWIEDLQLDSPPILVGHSMGGYLSLVYTLRHPGQVKALVLINPLYTPEQLTPLLRMASRRPASGEKALRMAPEWLMNLLLGWDPSKPADFPPEARRQIANDYKRASPHIVYVTQTISDLTPDLSQIDLPILVIWGDKDQTLSPSSFAPLVKRLPQAAGHEIPNCGHQPHIGKPALVNQVTLEFLSSLEPVDATTGSR